MKKAIQQAAVALKHGEVPIGALVIDKDDIIIGRGYNKIETTKCQSNHAEVRAINQACKKLDGWRLNGCRIYVTLEPCLMCFGLIQLSRCSEIIFGAKSNLFGMGLDDAMKIEFYAKNIMITHGVCAEESVALLQRFFSNIRQKGKVCCETKTSGSE